MPKFRKKPVVIEAVKWNGELSEEVKNFIPEERYNINTSFLIIHTLEGNMIAEKGDWIIKGVKGEFYPCKPDIFEKTYEEVK